MEKIEDEITVRIGDSVQCLKKCLICGKYQPLKNFASTLVNFIICEECHKEGVRKNEN